MSETAEKFVAEAIEEKKIQNMPHIMGLHDFFEKDTVFEKDWSPIQSPTNTIALALVMCYL